MTWFPESTPKTGTSARLDSEAHMSRLSSPPQYARIRMMIGQYGRTKQKNFVLFARLLGMTCKPRYLGLLIH